MRHKTADETINPSELHAISAYRSQHVHVFTNKVSCWIENYTQMRLLNEVDAGPARWLNVVHDAIYEEKQRV